ncbi:MAG: nucleolar RNA-binding Nop10p family protein [Candidatus Woesearchaeota archaeon]
MHILKCESCNNYTLKESCCSKKTVRVKPARFSPEDKYAKYRRMAKNVESSN